MLILIFQAIACFWILLLFTPKKTIFLKNRRIVAPSRKTYATIRHSVNTRGVFVVFGTVSGAEKRGDEHAKTIFQQKRLKIEEKNICFVQKSQSQK